MKHKQHGHKYAPRNILSFLLHEERRSGSLLLIAALLALILANSSLSHAYESINNRIFTVGGVSLDVKHWVSEGLMAIFFLVVTLEVKREFIDGELRTWRKASFPVVTAIGGMLIPAFIFTSFNQYPPASNGWAIPIATDIAIALSVLTLLGSRIPRNLRVFLLALAIIDDIASIIIIGFFYNNPENTFALVAAITAVIFLILFRRQKNWLLAFSGIGVLLWYCLTLAGISGTMTGVILAVSAPLVTRGKKSRSLQYSEKLENILIPVTAYFIVPLFVFSNAGLDLRHFSLSGDSSMSTFLGVFFGLFIGKPLGIVCAGLVGTLFGITKKPASVSWSQLLGVGFLAGIGFTVSLLIADLSFYDSVPLKNAAIFGVFTASISASLAGVLILLKSQKTRKKLIRKSI